MVSCTFIFALRHREHALTGLLTLSSGANGSAIWDVSGYRFSFLSSSFLSDFWDKIRRRTALKFILGKSKQRKRKEKKKISPIAPFFWGGRERPSHTSPHFLRQ